MKLIYPARPVQDLYLSGFYLQDTEYSETFPATNLVPGWNLIALWPLAGRGVIARLGVRLDCTDWAPGDPNGWRIAASAPGTEVYELASQLWIYGQFPSLRSWDVYPRLPFLENTTLMFYLYYEQGSGFYSFVIRHLLQLYS